MIKQITSSIIDKTNFLFVQRGSFLITLNVKKRKIVNPEKIIGVYDG